MTKLQAFVSWDNQGSDKSRYNVHVHVFELLTVFLCIIAGLD